MKTYDTIYLYLSAQDTNNISSLRRLEIRFLPLDPLMVTNIFQALQKNYVLQELILTDDCLQYCGIKEFKELFKALIVNDKNALTLFDFSRNYYSFDNNKDVHDELMNSILNQKNR
jgi:hypothetical protein